MTICLRLDDAKLAELVSNGATVSSGPHDTEAECLAACGGDAGNKTCGGYVIPNDLCLAITGDVFACTLPASMPLTYVSAEDIWTTATLECNGNTLRFVMVCINGQPYLFEVCNGVYRSGNTGVYSYDPFAFSGTAAYNLGSCVQAGASYSFVVTPGACDGVTVSNISRAQLSGTAGPIGYPNMSGVTVAADALLVVVVGYWATGTPAATYDGDAMAVTYIDDSDGMGVAVFSLDVTTLTTGNLVVSGLTGRAMAFAIEVTGLTNNAADVAESDSGAGANPETGATATTDTADEYVQGAFMVKAPSTTPPLWTNDFVTGVWNQFNAFGTVYRLVEGYRILTATGAPNGKILDSGVASFAGVTKAFK